MKLFHHPKCSSEPLSSSLIAGREICGNIPISSPSNIHPRNAAINTSHLPCPPRLSVGWYCNEIGSEIWVISDASLCLPFISHDWHKRLNKSGRVANRRSYPSRLIFWPIFPT
jgi:hypothetical protein